MLFFPEITLLLLNFQEYLDRFASFDIYLNSSTTPMIYVADVILSFNQTFTFLWTFFGLNVNLSRCSIDSVQITVRSNDTEQFVKMATIMIHNSSFGSLDLNPGTKAQITDCYIDGEFKQRPTLITANNSTVNIQNCHFEKFINQNGSTILLGHNNSHIEIENSVFIKHNSSRGVFFLQNNSSMRMSSSLFSQNVASTLGYSTITSKYKSHLVVKNTMFKNNSALAGGALIAQEQCKVMLNNCTFSSNKAITGKTLNISKNLHVKMTTNNLDQTSSSNKKPESIARKKRNISERLTGHHLHQNRIRTFATISSTLFNCTSVCPQTPEVIAAKTMNNSTERLFDQNNKGTFTPIVAVLLHKTSSAAKKLEVYAADQTHLLMNSSILRNAVRKEDYLPGPGGAVLVVTQSQLLVTNCVFEDNSAQLTGGAIIAGLDSTLDIKGTTFVGNKAFQGGAIEVEKQVQLSIKNCVFEDNSAQFVAGAIVAEINVTLHIQVTTFVGNKAAIQGGTIFVQSEVHLGINNCTFENNSAQSVTGAVGALHNVTVDIQGTKFVGNKALLFDGGAINIEQQGHLRITNSVFENNTCPGLGGAITGTDSTTLHIHKTNFTGNRASQSGAINIGQYGYLRITDCIFTDNHAKKIGGAVAGGKDVVLDIHETNFTGNSASEGGAINVQQQANLSLINCRLDGNFASDHSGAIASIIFVTLEIRGTNFIGNSAPNAAGALIVSQSQCHVVNCVFHSNTVNAVGGAVCTELKSSLQIENTNFTNNKSSDGGAVYLDSTSKLQANMCMFSKNFAQQSGGAVKLNGHSTVVIKSCQFLANHAWGGPGGALELNNQDRLSIRHTLFLRNVASADGGAVSVYGGAITIDNITCVGNQAVGFGGCLSITSVTLTLSNSNISQNIVEHQLLYGLGVWASDSRIQVGYLP